MHHGRAADLTKSGCTCHRHWDKRGAVGGGAPPSGLSGDRVQALSVLATAVRIGLGLVWIVAGAVKLPDPAAAVRAVRAYQLLPESLVAPVAFGLPVLEVVLGLALVLGVAVRLCAVASAALLLVYLAAVGSAWARGLTIDCGCFGGGGQVRSDQTAYGMEMLRDGGLLLASLALARRPHSRGALGLRWRAPVAGEGTHADRLDTPREADRAGRS